MMLGALQWLWCLVTFVPRRLCYYLLQARLAICGFNLQSKVVLVTGASSGIGREVSKKLYARGCKLILASRNEQELHKLRMELIDLTPYTAPSVKCHDPKVFPLDLSDLTSLPGKAVAANGLFDEGIDILINNGGISHRSSFENTDFDVHKKLMDVNYFGALMLIKNILPSMLARKEGQIINVSSLQGLFAVPHRSAYAASKHALQGFSDSLRAEVADSGVSVTVVSPGYIKTNISVNALYGDGSKFGQLDSNIAGGYPVDHCAEEIVTGIRLRKKELVIAPWYHAIAIYIKCLLPALYFKVMSLRARTTKPKTE